MLISPEVSWHLELEAMIQYFIFLVHIVSRLKSNLSIKLHFCWFHLKVVFSFHIFYITYIYPDECCFWGHMRYRYCLFQSYWWLVFFLNERHKIVPISLIKRGLQPASRKGQKTKGGLYNCAPKVARHLAPAESQSENSSFNFINKVMNRGLFTIEDSTISLFPNFPID
jgi:hypothetical protein